MTNLDLFTPFTLVPLRLLLFEMIRIQRLDPRVVHPAVLGVKLLVQQMRSAHHAQPAVVGPGRGAGEYALGELEHWVLGVLVLVSIVFVSPFLVWWE